MSNGPRILTLDIETAPLDVYCWGLWKQNIGLDMVKDEWTILSFAAKWFGDKKVLYHDVFEQFNKEQDAISKLRNDRQLIESLYELLDEADVVVMHNGTAFDLKRINTRILQHGLPPYSPVKIVDTLTISRRHFDFSSNRLEHLSRILTDTPKSKHGKFPGFKLWDECLKSNPAAWSEMRRYNIRDVIATEKLYKRFLPWISGHPNHGLWKENKGVPICPNCGGHTKSDGIYQAKTNTYNLRRCLKCRGWSRTRLPIREDRGHILVK